MSKKYIIHSDVELYSIHGPIPVYKLFQAYSAKALPRDFKVAGFGGYGTEVSAAIKSMSEVECPTGISLRVGGAGLQDTQVIFYPGQTFVDIGGKPISTEILGPGDLLVSLNGMVNTEYVGEVSMEDDMQTFYIIELDTDIPTLYANNIVIYPFEDGESKNSFFTK